MTGKNILRKLLDGHPNLICNHIHDRVALSLLEKDARNYISRPQTKNMASFQPADSVVEVKYTSGSRGLIDFSDLLNIFYRFGDYRMLQRCARLKTSYVAAKEGEFDKYLFNFDLQLFEQCIEEEVLRCNHPIYIERLIQIIYQAYCMSWIDIKFCKHNTNLTKTSPLGFVDTLPNGIDSINRVNQELPNSKILIMDREPVSLLFANAIRIAYKGGWSGDYHDHDHFFKRCLYSQRDFGKRIQTFRAKAKLLEAKLSNVLIVDFTRLLLDTAIAMKEISSFLEIPNHSSLCKPSISGRELVNSDSRYIGRVNDDPYSMLDRKELALLETLCHGPKYSLGIFDDAWIRFRVKAHKFRWLF